MKKTIITFILAVTALLVTTLHFLPGRRGPTPEPAWELVSNHTTATVYNAVPGQGNADYLHTASMYTIVPERIPKERILAMERTMMAELGIAYGDFVLIEGAGEYDGLWQVQDTMNRRFAGEHRIDFLVPATIRTGRWTGVKVYRKTTKNRQNYV